MKHLIRKVRPTKDFYIMLVVSLTVLLLASAYGILVGIPMTQARNQYNSAVRAYDEQQYDEAYDLIKQSLETWDTEDARLLKQELENRLNPYENSSE